MSMKSIPVAISSVDECGGIVKTRNRRVNTKKVHRPQKWLPKSIKLRNKLSGRSYLRTEETANGDRDEEFYEEEYNAWETKMIEESYYQYPCYEDYYYGCDYDYNDYRRSCSHGCCF